MHLLFPWLSVNCGSAASEDSKFNCHFTFDGSLHNTACKIALFHSHRSFHFDRHRIYVTESDMCSGDEYQRSLPEEVRGASAGFIVAARRGKCSFLTKNRVATNAGHPALIIINSDSEVFPFGEQSDVSAELVPAVMVEHSFQQSALSQCGFRDNCFVHNGILSFGERTNTSYEWYYIYMLINICINAP